MTLNQRIDKEYIEAYKARDAVRLGVLRLLKTSIKNRLVALKRPGGVLSEEELLDVIIKEAKQRQDSIEQYASAGRQDLADKESTELTILETYLPKALTDDELDKLVADAIHALNAKCPKDMGQVMKHVMGQYHGRVDGKKLSELVKKSLG